MTVEPKGTQSCAHAHDQPCPHLVRSFALGVGAPRAARNFVTDALWAHGHGGELVEDARLVVSELATNAVTHANSAFVVAIRPSDSCIRLSVRDSSWAQPVMRQPDALATSGRGMRVIESLASDWGVESRQSGKTVWAELAVG